MAQGRITKDQIAEKGTFDNISESAKIAEAQVKALEITLKAVVSAAKKVKSSISGKEPSNNQSIKERNDLLERSNKLVKVKINTEKLIQKANSDAEKSALRKNKALSAANKREEAAVKRRVKDIQILARKEAINNKKREKAFQRQRKNLADQSNAFKVLSKNVNSAQARFKRLAAQYGETDKRALKALKTFQRLDGRLRKINKTARDGRRDVGRYGLAMQNLNVSLKSLLFAGGVIGVVRGLGRAFSDAAQTVVQFDESVSDLQKVTGLAKNDARDLAEEILKIDTKTPVNEILNLATAGGRLGLEGQQLISFTKSADKAFVALGDSLEGSSEEIAVSLGKIASNFGIEQEFGIGTAIEKIGSSLNDLGAKSKANEGRIQDFTNRVAGIAVQAGLSLPNVQALGALFDEAGQSIEVSASTINKILPAIGKDTARFAKVAGLDIKKFEKLVSEKPLEALKAVAKGAKSSTKGLEGLSKTLENYGVNSARSASILGILSEKTERLTELQGISNDAFELGSSLSEEFAIKNETLAASQEKLGTTWDEFIISIENGDGVISNTFKRVLDLTTKLIEGFRRLNQSTLENIDEDLSIVGKGAAKTIEKRTKDSIANFKKAQDEELRIAVETANGKAKTAKRKSEIEEFFNERTISNDKKLEDFKKIARNNAIDIAIGFEERQRKRILDSNEFKDITIKNAKSIIESNKKSFASSITGIEILGDETRRRKREEAGRIASQTRKIEVLRALKNETKKLIVVEEEEVDIVISGGSENVKVKKELIGLINNQSKAVLDLNKKIREATDEDNILSLSIDLDKEKEELSRLKRIVNSTFEEIQKIELNLIDDTTEKAIQKEVEKSEKIIKQLETNSRIQSDKKEELIAKENKRLDEFIENQQINKLKKAIDFEADLAKAEIEQRRSGFKTEEEFEEFKASEFNAIKRNQLQAELDLLNFFDREEDTLRIEQLKAQIEGLHQFEEATKLNLDAVKKAIQLVEDVIVKSIDARIDKLSDEEQAHRDGVNEFKQAARDGNIVAKESLAEEQILADEAERKQAKLEQKKQNILLVTSVLKAFVLELENPENSGNSLKAFGKAVLSVGAIEAFAGALPAFLEGTENTGVNGQGIDGKGGFHAVLHPNEKVFKSEHTDMIGGFSNEEVARTMEQKRLGNLMGDTHLIAQANGIDLSGMEAKLDDIKRVIVDKPENTVEIGAIMQESFNIIQTRKQGNRVTNNRFKVKAN